METNELSERVGDLFNYVQAVRNQLDHVDLAIQRLQLAALSDTKDQKPISTNNREPKLPLDIKEAVPQLFPPTEMSLRRAYEDGAIAMYNLLERQRSAAR
jgi:hypothetical protein